MYSVIIPYYNKSAYIIRCIDSVLRQAFAAYEIIVVDDGSTDNGIELISEKYGQLITIYSQKNQGVSAARNAGISQAKYDYVALLDADDTWHPQYLESVNWVIRKEKEVKIIGSHYARSNDFFDVNYESPKYFKFSNYFKEAIRNTYFTSSSSVIQKKFFDENNGFNTNLQKGEDHDVWFRVIQSGGNSFYITNTLVYYSDEDSNQATKSKIALENHLVGNINTLYKDLKVTSNDKDFNRFISLYTYFNLYPYFFNKENNHKAKAVLKENEYTFLLLKLVYLIPFSIGEKMVKSDKYTKFLRLYLKFIIRYTIK
jgi:glycosyltransferase involved in cell wall biosynthesis